MGESEQLVLQHYIRPGRFISSQHQMKTRFQKILIQALVYTGLQELAGLQMLSHLKTIQDAAAHLVHNVQMFSHVTHLLSSHERIGFQLH